MKLKGLLFLLLLMLSVSCTGNRSTTSATQNGTQPVSKTTTATITVTNDNPLPSPSPTSTFAHVTNQRIHMSDFQAGVNVLIYGNDQSFDLKIENLLTRLIDDNVNSVSLVFPLTQSAWNSSEVSTFDMTLSDKNIEFFVNLAHQHGFTVLLRPLIDETNITKTGGKWRGNIKPQNVNKWFESYGALMLHYASLAQKTHAEMLSLGVELNSMVADKYCTSWVNLIAKTRAVFDGSLTYSTNWDFPPPLCFWDKLDFIGVDAFYRMEVPLHPSVQQIVYSWNQTIQPVQGFPLSAVSLLKSAAKTYGKPVVLTEVGVISQEGAVLTPWQWDLGKPVDLDSQHNFFAATCMATKGTVAGLYFWNAGLDTPKDPSKDTGFDFIGKPAEQALAQCYQ